MSASARTLSWFGGTVLCVSWVAAVLAQGRSEGTDAATSLAPVTSELRQLRVAVEELTRSQTQTQALGVYLSVQQSRILQVVTRLDSARKDIETVTANSQKITERLANLTDDLPHVREPERRELEGMIQHLKQEKERVGLQEQQARARESELSQTLDLEEARWKDLISRLEQLTKR